VLFPPNRIGLHPDEVTVAEVAKSRGYETMMIGKWHLGHFPEFLPTRQGFDHFFGLPYSNDMKQSRAGFPPLPLYRDEKIVETEPDQSQLTRRYTEEAVKFLRTKREKPFFLYLSFNAVHSPIVASPKWLEKFQHLDKREQAYAALIGEADEAIGTVLTKLRELKLEENTLIFCISDNGGASPISEQMGLRGHKWFVWEGGIRVTWMAQWKGRIPGGRVVNDPIIQLDVLPTALAAANATALVETLDGVNLLPLLEGKTDKLAPRELFFRFGVQHAVRQGDWKLVKASKDMEPMLVNLATDPGEQKDLSTENPAKKTELQTLWEKWDASMQPPRWEDQRWNGDEKRKEKKKKGKKK
jgi:arylsulfatase A-like enzyme